MTPSQDTDPSFRSADLVRTFAVRAAAATIILALVIGVAASLLVESVMQTEAVRVSSIAADALLRHELTNVPLDQPLPAQVVRNIDEVCLNDLSKNGITAVKLWSRNGTLLYSSDSADAVGSREENQQALEAATSGEVVTEISETPDDEDSRQFPTDGGPIVEVYAPLDRGAVVELYQSFSPIAAGVQRTRGLAWLAVLALAVPAYFIELQIVRRAARKLDGQETALSETNDRLAASLVDLEAHTLGTLSALAATVDAKDSYTSRHSHMVADYSAAIASRMGLTPEECDTLQKACLLHDIGKIAVPESILLKPGRLDAEERELIQEHSAKGAAIIASIPFLKTTAAVVRHHHERCDGLGYPDGLTEDEIPRLSLILAVADTFDAMTSNRPYRDALTPQEAREELQRCAGTQLCTAAVDAFLAALDAGEISVGERHVIS